MRTAHIFAAILLMAGTTAIAQTPTAPNNPAGRANTRDRATRMAPRLTGEITRVSGRVISVNTLRGETVAVTVPASAQILKSDRTAGTFADLKTGKHVLVTGTRPTATTATAQRVVIVNPTATGTIAAVSASRLTLRLPDGKTAAYTVNSTTRWLRNREAGPWTNFKTGERVIVEYNDKTATAVRLAPSQRTPGQRTPGQRTPGQRTPGQRTPGRGAR